MIDMCVAGYIMVIMRCKLIAQLLCQNLGYAEQKNPTVE